MCKELSLYDLEYPDNMALISDSMDLLEEVMQAMEIGCAEMTLTIASKKTNTPALRSGDL